MTAHLMVGDHSATPGRQRSVPALDNARRLLARRCAGRAGLQPGGYRPRVRTPMAGSIDEAWKKGET
jgi:hypothetical protein